MKQQELKKFSDILPPVNGVGFPTGGFPKMTTYD
jgi:hypothetical protein